MRLVCGEILIGTLRTCSRAGAVRAGIAQCAPRAFGLEISRGYAARLRSPLIKRGYNSHSGGLRPSQAIVVPDNGNLRVIFEDNSISDFHPLWLRDNCHCPECVHPDTKQKLLDTAGLDVRVHISETTVNGGTVSVTFTDGHKASLRRHGCLSL